MKTKNKAKTKALARRLVAKLNSNITIAGQGTPLLANGTGLMAREYYTLGREIEQLEKRRAGLRDTLLALLPNNKRQLNRLLAVARVPQRRGVVTAEQYAITKGWRKAYPVAYVAKAHWHFTVDIR